MRNLNRPTVAVPGRVTPVLGLVLIIIGAGFVPGLTGPAATDGRLAIASSGTMTIYEITNLNLQSTYVEQVFTDSTGHTYRVSNTLAAGSSVIFHLRDITQVPSGFNGTLTIYSDHPVTALLIGYDDGNTPAPTSTGGPPPTRTTTPAPRSTQLVPSVGTRTYLPLVKVS